MLVSTLGSFRQGSVSAFAKAPARFASALAGRLDDTPEVPIGELREAVRRFAQSEIAPKASSFDEAGSVPASLWRDLGSLGALGVTTPTSYGGLGLGHLAHCAVIRELSRASASVGLSYAAHSNLCMRQIVKHGSDSQKDKWLPGLVEGTSIGALAMSEVGAGSDVVAMRARAKRCEQNGEKGWLLNGGKMWITNGPIADVFVVYAKTGDEGTGTSGKDGITAFVLEAGMKGFSTAQKLDKLGMRASETCELVFEDVFIPDHNVLGGVGRGVYVLMAGLDSERLVLSAGPLGIMDACLFDVALPYVRTREQFGKPIGEFQLMQAKVADMYTAHRATEALVEQTAREMDGREFDATSKTVVRNSRRDCATAILFAAENATKVALETVQALGGNGYVNEYPAARLLRDAKLYEIGAGTSEVRRLLIGRELFQDDSLGE